MNQDQAKYELQDKLTQAQSLRASLLEVKWREHKARASAIGGQFVDLHRRNPTEVDIMDLFHQRELALSDEITRYQRSVRNVENEIGLVISDALNDYIDATEPRTEMKR